MVITMTGFGAFDETHTARLETQTAPNGAGKTTIVNAYVWLLTGRALPGFKVRNVKAEQAGRHAEVYTRFILNEAGAGVELRRTTTPKGTQLYADGDAVSQTEFEQRCAAGGLDVAFVASLADANVLTAPGLTSDALRRFLSGAGVYEGDRVRELRDQLKATSATLREAEQYALTNVTVPDWTVEPCTAAELKYLGDYERTQTIAARTISVTCPTCGQLLSPGEVLRAKTEKEGAERFVREGAKEAERIRAKRDAYIADMHEIELAQAMINRAAVAREQVRELRETVERLQEQIRQADKDAVRAALPKGVTMHTDGRSQVELYYDGVPLKSVNRGKRIELCVRMMHAARAARGLEDVAPIVVDNAESVQDIDDIPNLVCFYVG